MTDELKKDKVLDNEKADMSDSFMARQIVQEILNFGVSQSQMLKVIQILLVKNCLIIFHRKLENWLKKILTNLTI